MKRFNQTEVAKQLNMRRQTLQTWKKERPGLYKVIETYFTLTQEGEVADLKAEVARLNRVTHNLATLLIEEDVVTDDYLEEVGVDTKRIIKELDKDKEWRIENGHDKLFTLLEGGFNPNCGWERVDERCGYKKTPLYDAVAKNKEFTTAQKSKIAKVYGVSKDGVNACYEYE